MSHTFFAAPAINRVRNTRNKAAFIVPVEINHRTLPWFVTVETMFTLNRLPGTINSGVAPGRA